MMDLRVDPMSLMRVQQMALRVDLMVLMVLMALRAEMMALRVEFTTKVLTIVGLGNKVPAKMVLRETIQKMKGETPMEAKGILQAAMTRLETMTRWKNYLTRKLIKEMRIRQNTLMERTTKKHVFNFNCNWVKRPNLKSKAKFNQETFQHFKKKDCIILIKIIYSFSL